MRSAGVAVVRNEADIIEAFVRHNLGHLDTVHVVDNGSTDGTREILADLVAEGLPLTVADDMRADHPQEDVVSALLERWEDSPDWVFCLDADEFLTGIGGADVADSLSALDPTYCQLLAWRPYVPTQHDDQSEPNPLRRIVHRRTDYTNPWMSKVAVPKRYLKRRDVTVTAGNHMLLVGGLAPHHEVCTTLALAHFPVRSVNQLAAKVIVGDWAISTRATRSPGEGRHWSGLIDRFVAGTALRPEEMTDLAANYGEVDPVEPITLIREPLTTPVTGLRHRRPEVPYQVTALRSAQRHFRSLRRVAFAAGDLRIVKTRTGLVAVAMPADPVGQALLAYGEWLGPQLDLLLPRVPKDGTVVHVGTGNGHHTLAYSRAVGADGRVFAWDPDPAQRELLALTLRVNAIRNVDLMSRTSGPDQLELTELALLVVQGDVSAVLRGGLDTIQAHAPVIVASPEATERDDVITLLSGLGLRCAWLIEPDFDPVNFFGAGPESEEPPESLHVSIVATPPGKVGLGLPDVADHPTWEDAWQALGRKPYRPSPVWGKGPVV